MDSRIVVQGTHVFIRLLQGSKGQGQIGFLLKWHEGLDFADQLVDACTEAKAIAEAEHLVPYDRKNQ